MVNPDTAQIIQREFTLIAKLLVPHIHVINSFTKDRAAG